MVRLVILMGPIGSILGAQTVTLWIEWAIKQIQLLIKEGLRDPNDEKKIQLNHATSKMKKKEKKLKKKNKNSSSNDRIIEEMFKPMTEFMNSNQGDSVKKIGAIALLMFLCFQGIMFWKYSQRMAKGMSVRIF